MYKPDLKEERKKKIETLLKDKNYLIGFMVWFIEDFPDSFEKINGNGILG